MKEESLIHLRFEYPSALEAKKDILYSEKRLIGLVNIMKNYQELKNLEMRLKLKMHRKMKEILNLIKKLHQEVPHIKQPQYEEKEEVPRKVKERVIRPEVKKEDSSIEAQIREIQNKLNSIHQI